MLPAVLSLIECLFSRAQWRFIFLKASKLKHRTHTGNVICSKLKYFPPTTLQTQKIQWTLLGVFVLFLASSQDATFFSRLRHISYVSVYDSVCNRNWNVKFSKQFKEPLYLDIFYWNGMNSSGWNHTETKGKKSSLSRLVRISIDSGLYDWDCQRNLGEMPCPI